MQEQGRCLTQLIDRSRTEEASIRQGDERHTKATRCSLLSEGGGVNVAALIFAIVVLQAALRSETSSELLLCLWGQPITPPLVRGVAK